MLRLILLGSLAVFIYNCAAEAPASGGPEDVLGPSLLYVSPPSGTTDLGSDQRITLRFSERIDPLSVPASVRIEPFLDYKIRTRGGAVTITPQDDWPKDVLIRIRISRSVRDYRKNMQDTSRELVYSRGIDIPQGKITGQLVNYNPEKTTELGIYTYPLSDSSKFLSKTEADLNGKFVFDYLTEGRYSVMAVEGILDNFAQKYRKNRYGFMPYEVIELKAGDRFENLQIRMDEPLQRLTIKSVEFLHDRFFQLTFDDGSVKPYIFKPDHEISSGDSFFLELDLENRLETYRTEPYWLIMPELTDTIPPAVEDHSFLGYDYFINFSEPVSLLDQVSIKDPFFVRGYQDTLALVLLAYWADEFSLKVSDIPPGMNEIRLEGNSFVDLHGNTLKDSITVIRINWSEYPKSKRSGDIRGRVVNNPGGSVTVSARNVIDDTEIHAVAIGDNFELSKLPPGNYLVTGFEMLGTDPDVYFSGLWEPYHRSARVTAYPDTVEVRAHWIVEGIDLDFSATAISLIPKIKAEED